MLNKGQFGEARLELRLAGSFARDENSRANVYRLLLRLEAEGQRLLQDANKLADAGRYPEALTQYDETISSFTEMPSASGARAARLALLVNPEVRALVAEMEAAKISAELADVLGMSIEVPVPAEPVENGAVADTAGQASSTSTPGGTSAAGIVVQTPPPTPAAGQVSRTAKIKSSSIEKQQTAMEMLRRLANTYSQTKAGKAAVADLQVLERDRGFMAGLANAASEREGRRVYNLGMAYMHGGLRDLALEQFGKIIQEYPDTEIAREAERRIAQLQ